MLDIVNTRSFTTEDEARSFIIENQANPDQNNLARAGTGWVVVDPTPRPELWKGKKVATDSIGASIDALTNRLDLHELTTGDGFDALTARIDALENEIAGLRTELRSSES